MNENINDFYYSATQHGLCVRLDEHKGRPHTTCRFKGRIFTEQVLSGSSPVSKFEDMEMIGTGHIWDDCSYKLEK